MKTFSCDVLVVGAGPAGSSAARAAARENVRTIMVDSRKHIGSPVQCAEFIPIQLLSQTNLTPDCVAQRIEGMKTFLPGGEETVTKAKGRMVHRDRFDQLLARQAQEAGALLMTGIKVVGRRDDGTVVARTRDRAQEEIHIKARVIIGADGPRSTVGSWVGAVNTHLLPGIQCTLPLLRPENYTEVYFDPEIFGGYCWFFPKNDQVNIGLGMQCPRGNRNRLRPLLTQFIERFAAEGRISSQVLGTACGWIPAEPLRNAVYGDVLLTGDAAGHTHPITGAGIFAAVTCGEMAGRHAGLAVQKDSISHLQEYEQEWQGLFGTTLQRAAMRRELMESSWSAFEPTIRRTWVAFKEYYA